MCGEQLGEGGGYGWNVQEKNAVLPSTEDAASRVLEDDLALAVRAALCRE